MSTLIEKIKTAFIGAYKAKELDLKNVIGTLKGEIERTSKDPKNISDEHVTKVFKGFIKNHNNGEAKLTDMEVTFIESILPSQIGEAEIDAKIQELVDGGANHIGKFMGAFKGMNVDMKIVKEKVESILKPEL